jgi:two-component system phosphate regulon sensor histidine kinase PhoR
MKKISAQQCSWAATAAATAAVLAFLAAFAPRSVSAVLAAGAVVILSAAAGALQCAVLRNERRETAVVRRYLELLGHSQQAGLTSILNAHSLPTLDPQSPWHRPLTGIRDYLASFQDRQADAESARAALEVRLQRTTTRLDLMQAVLAKLNEPVFVVDDYNDLLLANPEAERRLGAAGDKRRLNELLPNEKLTALIADVRRRNVPTHRADDVEWAEADGQKRCYRAAVDNLSSAATGTGGGAALVVLRDVSAAREAHRRHAEFVSAASHEMKTPLAGIKAYVELLADGEAESDADREEFLDVIAHQTDRLQRLIENLLNIARIEAGVVKVSKQSRSVNEIVAETIDVVRPAAEAKQITLVSDLSPLYLGALVDRDLLAQAVINLMSNAVKYTPVGGRVTLRSRLADHEIQIDVDDTGVGLSEEDCGRVFEKFYRVEKDKTMASGTGLGLPLVKNIVEDVHGGRLDVRSKLGEGSTFSIFIPAAGRTA